MHIKLFAATFLALSILLFTHCKQSQKLQQPASAAANNKGLGDYYKDYFPIGVAVNTRSLTGEDSALIMREFNSITPENDMNNRTNPSRRKSIQLEKCRCHCCLCPTAWTKSEGPQFSMAL